MTNMLFEEQLSQAAAYISAHAKKTPRVAITLGSGLGGLSSVINVDAELPYGEIHGFSRTTVPGHDGKLLLGEISGVPCAILCGRVHMYEGHTAQEAAFSTYALRKAGVEMMIFTNAAGGINACYKPGDLVLVRDHINPRGVTPITPEVMSVFGSGFIDMTRAYDPALIELILAAAEKLNIHLQEGVYLMAGGPQFETPAEIRSFRLMGADLVGMSTVPEVIAARHCGARAAVLSCVTNMAAGMTGEPLSHQEVMETGARMRDQLIALIKATLAEIKNTL